MFIVADLVSLNYHLSLRPLLCQFLSGRFTQILLYSKSELKQTFILDSVTQTLLNKSLIVSCYKSYLHKLLYDLSG